jgi:hypothetical protein
VGATIELGGTVHAVGWLRGGMKHQLKPNAAKENMDKLKYQADSTYVTIEAKHADAQRHADRKNVVCLTNHEDALGIDANTGTVSPARRARAVTLSGCSSSSCARRPSFSLAQDLLVLPFWAFDYSPRSGTGFKFVEQHRDKYLATIQKDGKQRKPSFATPEEAALCVARSLGAQGAAAQAAVARATAARPPPMTRREALAAAAAEGLTHLLTSSSGTCFKGVTTAGKKYKASFSVPGTRDLKYNHTTRP